MSEQIVAVLKRKLDDLAAFGGIDAETRRNALKEELQFYVLDFIYHHKEYSKWIMYGGSALRIVHGLDRMSVDLDFEVSREITTKYLNKLRNEIGKHFSDRYGTDSNFLAVKIVSGRGLLLKFDIGERLDIGHPSKQIHVKIDLNHFVAPKTVVEKRPINRDQLSFIIATYNMAALMASKVAAIFLRGSRGIGKAVYGEKGRDIYDLLWYMNKKIIPDFDYLKAKNVDAKDPRTLFDKLTLRMNKVSDENLKQDLLPLFTYRTYIENWLKNWRASYLRLIEAYRINTVLELKSVGIHQDFDTDNFQFRYLYETDNSKLVKIVYLIGDRWIKFKDGDLAITIDKKVADLVEFADSIPKKPALRDKLKQYVTLFWQKTESYFKKTNRVMLGDGMTTKLIRMTADNLNRKEHVLLDKSALLSAEFDDLLK